MSVKLVNTFLLKRLARRRGGLGHEVLEQREGPVAASGRGVVHVASGRGQSQCSREIGEVGTAWSGKQRGAADESERRGAEDRAGDGANPSGMRVLVLYEVRRGGVGWLTWVYLSSFKCMHVLWTDVWSLRAKLDACVRTDRSRT